MLGGLLIATVALAALSDLRERTIPNWISVSGLLLALAVRALPGGPELMPGLMGFGLAALVTVPMFAVGVMGGGDTKLLMAVGGFLGPLGFLAAFLYAALVGGVMAFAGAARSGSLRALVQRTIAFVVAALSLGRKGIAASVSAPGAVTLPYGVAIAVGAVAAQYLPFAL